MYSQKILITKRSHNVICLNCGTIGTYFNFIHLSIKEFNILKDEIYKVKPNFNYNICPNCRSVNTEIYDKEIIIETSMAEIWKNIKPLPKACYEKWIPSESFYKKWKERQTKNIQKQCILQ